MEFGEQSAASADYLTISAAEGYQCPRDIDSVKMTRKKLCVDVLVGEIPPVPPRPDVSVNRSSWNLCDFNFLTEINCPQKMYTNAMLMGQKSQKFNTLTNFMSQK